MISIEEFKKIEIRAGKILSAEKVEGADKLLRLSVELGEPSPRQIISGIALYFPDPSVLAGRLCAFVTNLEPRVFRGLESEGMILATGGVEEPFSLLQVSADIVPGSLVK